MAASGRLGRPPATNSAETRVRILDAARSKFAAHWYESASNRALAEAAGLTTGAIYHYFDSKLDIYTAVYADAREMAYTRFEKAIVGHETFASQLAATLEVAHELNVEDPTLAQFLGSSRVDVARDPILAEAVRAIETSTPITFFEDLVDLGIETGEIAKADRPLLLALLRTIVVGLTDAVSGDQARHRQAVDAINRLLAGDLVSPASSR
ncbi:MAG: TetR/AcrR family transcriptional regulator [Actinomycetota bacterium]